MNDTSPEPQMPEAAKLGDEYDGCLLGATIGIGTDLFVYSIRQLIGMSKVNNPGKPVSEIRKTLAAEIQEVQRIHGILAPIFVNDELVAPIEDDKPVSKIVIPGKPNWTPPPVN